MFLELPELNPRPFPRLRYIEYSGPVSPAVLQFLTSHSPLLRSLTLKASESVLEPSSALRFLHLNTKPDLESLRVELVVATKGATLLSEMKRIIEASPKLTVIGNEVNLNKSLNISNNEKFQEILIHGATCCRQTFNSSKLGSEIRIIMWKFCPRKKFSFIKTLTYDI